MSAGPADGGPPERDSTGDTGETEAEKLDRNTGELLQEVRVAQTGVQILFAFLLTLPFQQRFVEITAFQRGVYLVTLLLAAGAAALLVAPVSLHRVVFRKRQKRLIVALSQRAVLGGLALLALALSGAVLLVTDVVLGTPWAGWLAGGVALWYAVFWYAVPLWLRRRPPESYRR